MSTATYITADKIGAQSGGGIVTINEMEALRDLVGFENVSPILGAQEVNPICYGQPYNVFLEDYFALHLIQDQPIKLAHFYSGTFSHTVRRLKEHGARISYTVPAHDRKTTIGEFQNLGIPYPYNHISDEGLWQKFSQGYREADLVIAPSQASANSLRAEGCHHVVVISHGHNPVDPKSIVPFPRDFKLGILGQVLGPDKGLIYLLQAWAKLNYSDAAMFIAGPGTEKLTAYIQRVAGRGHFELLGFIPRAESLYNSVTVYCQPSVVEAFGLEILEAMAYGRPVIACTGAGASELITDGVDGFVVPIRDVDAIADRIHWCRQNQDKLVAMGRKAMEKAAQFTWEKVRQEYQRLWRTLL